VVDVRCSKCGGKVSEYVLTMVSAQIMDEPTCGTCFVKNSPEEPSAEPIRNWKGSAWFPEKYHFATVDDFDNGELMDLVREWYKSKSQILTLSGSVGSGKTHLACALAYRLHDIADKICRFVTAPDLVDIYRGAACGDDSSVSKKMMVTGCNVLVLDDLGAQRNNEFSYEAIYSILSNGQRLIVTTNLDSSGIATELDGRVASRLNGGYVVIFEGKDRRAEGSQSRILKV